MKLYDCSMYFDEDLMLDIRLNTLSNYVEKFIIAEATRDHSGKEKKLNFDIKKFSKFKNKINYLIIEDLPIGQIKGSFVPNKRFTISTISTSFKLSPCLMQAWLE